MFPLGLLRRLPVVLYCRESIFKYKYLWEYDAKIDKIYTLVCGLQDVSLGIEKLKKLGLLDCLLKSACMSQLAYLPHQ